MSGLGGKDSRADAADIDVPMTLGQKRKMFSLGSASDFSDDALWTTALPFMGDARTSSSDDDGVSRALAAAAAAAVFLRVCRAGMVAAKLCPVSRQKTSSLSMCRKCARAGRGRRCNGGSVTEGRGQAGGRSTMACTSAWRESRGKAAGRIESRAVDAMRARNVRESGLAPVRTVM